MTGMQTTTFAPSPSADAQGAAARPLSFGLALGCLALFTIAYITNAMDRQIFPMLLTWINKSYNFSLSNAGLMATVFTLGIGLAAWPVGYLLDHKPRKAILLWGMVIYSVFTLMTIFAYGFADMVFYRAMTGVGETMQIAALFAAAGSYFYKNKALVIGTIDLGFGLGGFLGPYLGTSLTLATDDWRIPFAVFAALGLVMALVLLVAVPKSFTESKGPVAGNAVEAALLDNMPAGFWNRNLVLSGASAVLWGFCLYGFIGLYSTYLISGLHYAPMVVGATFGMFGIGAMLSGVPAGWVSDRLSHRWAAIVAWAALAIVWYLMYNVAFDQVSQKVLTFLVGMFASGFLHANGLTLVQRSVRPQFVGRATGYYSACAYLAASVAGFVFAQLVGQFGWGGAGFVQLTLFPVLGVIALFLMKDGELLQANRPR